MNKFSINLTQPTLKYLAIVLTIFGISACADTGVVTLEKSVEQHNDLIDYDSDGVIKAREKCDGTTLGASIDNYGCGTQISKIEPFKINIKFEHNSYEIPESAYVEIKKLADFLKKHSEINLLIEGHTSKVGTVKLNQKLSNNRAKAVALVLTSEYNIAESRISSIGYGFERLEEIDDTELAHAANRRIMAEVSFTESMDELKWTIYTVDQAN